MEGGGGGEWNMQLAKCFLNVNFSLGQDSHEC